MRQLNQGLIYTNENCIGCNRCIGGCPVLGANVAVIINKENKIMVDGNKCIHCGHCLEVCTHGARDYRDDTARFFEDLRGGFRIAMLVDPSFFVEYPEQSGEILKRLREAGVSAFYHVGFGADIHTLMSINYMTIAEQEGCISSILPPVVNYAEKYAPKLIDRLIPVLSPAQCTAVYVSRYLKDGAKLAYFGRHIASGDEFEDPEFAEMVSYHLMFDKVLEYLEMTASIKEAEKPLPELTAAGDAGLKECLAVHDAGEKKEDLLKVELSDCGLGATICGGMGDSIRHYLGNDVVLRSCDEEDIYAYMHSYEERMNQNHRTPLMVDVTASYAGGEGSGKSTDDELFELMHIRSEIIKKAEEDPQSPFSEKAEPERRLELLRERFKDLRSEDFVRNFHRDRAVIEEVTPAEEEEIYRQMYKFTPQDRCINCNACGYGTCAQMVRAIAMGHESQGELRPLHEGRESPPVSDRPPDGHSQRQCLQPFFGSDHRGAARSGLFRHVL